MTNDQHKIGTGFSSRSTADDVLHGVDLSGKLAVITGGHSGLGLASTRALVKAGAQVVVLARHQEMARQAVGTLPGVEVHHVDLADLINIREFSARFLASGRSIDLMINNAGIMACPETRVGPGWEAQFAVNHLGHYALVNQLWPALARGKGTRVVTVSSGRNPFSRIRWDDLHFSRGYDKWEAYAQSKTANALFTVALDRLGQAAGVRAFSVHPGYILTPLQRHLSRQEMVAAGWIDENGHTVGDLFKTPEQGAATQVWAATSPQLAGLGGLHCEDCDLAEVQGTAGMAESEGDLQGAADRLWMLSAELTAINAFDDPHHG